MRYFIAAAGMLAPASLWAATSDDFLNTISPRDWEELYRIVATATASCAEKVFTDQQDLMQGVKALVRDIAGGAAQVSAEFGTSLAMKPGYPNLCHVMPTEILKDISPDSSRKDKHCIVKAGGNCIKKETRVYTTYAYYWPKYFIEVSDKGNDPHPAFAHNNKLYAAGRRLASSLDNLIDSKGPYTLAAKVIGASKMINEGTKSVTGGKGLDMRVSGQELAEASKTAVLTPLEKLRLRASHDAYMPSYEANIWPVGMSKSVAEHFSVCGDSNPNTDEGGFGWPIPGVAMTCPVAMARDAWAYWDSGMLDYLNPNAIRGMATAANPASCVADNLASLAFDEYAPKAFNSALGSSEGNELKVGRVNSMPQPFAGLRYCSFPIMGDTEAIYGQYARLPESFKGPWCTLWGSVAPRSSASPYRNDYSYVNSALKFKTLAHDIFGVPRGKKERWSLAYPWEDSPQSFLGEYSEKLADVLGISKTSETFKKYFSKGVVGRSRMLMVPGDPRLIDSKLSPVLELANVENAANLGKEAAYLASLKQIEPAGWVAAEIARAKHENQTGKSLLPGRKKVYTIYEQVTCEPQSYVANLGYGIKKYGRCGEAVKFEVRRFIQTRILRKACDAKFVFNSPLGKPFK